MPNFCASAVRRLVLLLGVATIVIATPDRAQADRPSATTTASAQSRPKPKAVASSRSRARAAARRSATSRARSRRVRRNLGPIIPNVAQASFTSDSADVLRDSIVSLARQQIGTPYVWGAETPGRAFDCSGLVKYVMSWLNVSLPRTAHEQSYTGIRVGRELDRMKPGDLLTFGTGRRITHIAIYSGNGKYVHASRPGVGVVESLLNTRAARFKGAVRLVADADTTTAKTELIP
jgi:cell wall-associated NlpC family hydrolase